MKKNAVNRKARKLIRKSKSFFENNQFTFFTYDDKKSTRGSYASNKSKEHKSDVKEKNY